MSWSTILWIESIAGTWVLFMETNFVGSGVPSILTSS